MAFDWYFQRRGREFGPYSGAQLKKLAASGRLEPHDMVRRSDRTDAVTAAKIKGLFPAVPPQGSQEVGASALPTPEPSASVKPSPVPPPLPTPDGHSDGIGERLKGLGEVSKAAARLAAAQARKAHLVNVVLPAAYLDLGRDIHAAGRFRDEFPEMYVEVAELERRIERLTSAQSQTGSATSLADRAKHAATGAKEKAQAKALSMKKESLLRRLGKSAYTQYREASGPEHLVQSIGGGLSRADALNQECISLTKVAQGRLVIPQRMIVGSLSLLILGVMIVALKPTTPGNRGGIQATSDGGGESVPLVEPATPNRLQTAPSGEPIGSIKGGVVSIPVIDRPVATMKAEYRVERCSFSPDGGLLAVNDELWRLSSRQRLTQGDGGPRFGAGLSFSPDGSYLACVNRTVDHETQNSYAELRTFRVTEDGVELVKKLRIKTALPDGFWRTTRWSPCANYLAVVSGEALIVVSDPMGAPQERMIVHPSLLEGDVNGLGRLVGPSSSCYVAGLDFSPDEKSLALAFNERGVHLFGLPDCKRLATLAFPGTEGDWEWSLGLSKRTLGYTADGGLLITRQNRKGRRDEKGEWINSLESLTVWDTSSWSVLRTIEEGSGSPEERVVNGFLGLLSGSPQGLVYLYNANSSCLLLWDCRSGKLVELIRPPLIPGRTTEIAWTPDSSKVVFTQVQGPIEGWDIDNKQPMFHIRDELAEHRTAFAVSADGTLIATGYPNGEVTLWDAGAPGRSESLEALTAEAGRIRRDDDRQRETQEARPPFRSSDVTTEQFLRLVQSCGEVMNPRKGLPILISSKYALRAALGEPTNVLSSVREFGRGTHEVLDYACSDGRVLLSVTYDGAGAWIKEVAPQRSR